MSNEFKRCPNGHYYQGLNCPYCKTTKNAASGGTKTSVFVGTDDPTETNIDGNPRRGTKTEITPGIGGTETTVDPRRGGNGPTRPTRTIFGDPEAPTDENGTPGEKPQGRYARKLVGWLVTYSLDELGVDYKLYEGRNIIGRNEECNITVNDARMSGQHAVLLFRADKYSLTDSQSSHGTFVNEEDIELEPRYLKDGDTIRMGSTVFKFRTSF